MIIPDPTPDAHTASVRTRENCLVRANVAAAATGPSGRPRPSLHQSHLPVKGSEYVRPNEQRDRSDRCHPVAVGVPNATMINETRGYAVIPGRGQARRRPWKCPPSIPHPLEDRSMARLILPTPERSYISQPVDLGVADLPFSTWDPPIDQAGRPRGEGVHTCVGQQDRITGGWFGGCSTQAATLTVSPIKVNSTLPAAPMVLAMTFAGVDPIPTQCRTEAFGDATRYQQCGRHRRIGIDVEVVRGRTPPMHRRRGTCSHAHRHPRRRGPRR